MDILFVEPYCAGSHRAFSEGYAAHSAHDVQLLTMPGQRWKQRMRGGSLRLAEQVPRELPDLIMASDYLDVPAFKSASEHVPPGLPIVIYFHENQLTYPLREGQKREFEFAHSNVTSCFAAEQVLFNSEYHRESFLKACDELYRRDETGPRGVAERIRKKSQVVPVGVELDGIDAWRRDSEETGSLTILWNHRWEYDKCPETFFRVMEQLDSDGLDFTLAVAGQTFSRKPPVFERVKRSLSHRLEVFGTVTPRSEYLRLLVDADVVVSTAMHEFFGIAVVEATYAGCAPLVPDRLSYPELIPARHHDECLYRDEEELYSTLARWMENPEEARSIDVTGAMRRFKWDRVAPLLDTTLSDVCAS